MSIKRIIFVLAACCAACLGVDAAYPQYVRITTDDGRTVSVTAVAENIFRVTNTADGETARKGEASVIDESSEGLCLNPDGRGVQANICGVGVTLTSNGIAVLNAGSGKTVVDNGIRAVGADGRRSLSLVVDGKGSFYGAGERGHKLNLRGDTLVMYNRQNYGYTGNDPRIRQMNITMPLFLSADGYAIVFDDFAPAEMILGDTIRYITESPQPVSWYFVNGAKTLADVTESLTRLTGRQSLPPLWTLGYITSKYGYHNRAETEGVVDTLRNAGYPLDGIVLDLYWYGREQDMGRLAWDAEQWPGHVEMLGNLADKGVNLVAISQPYILRNGRGIDNYGQLAASGLMMADSTGTAPQDVTIWVGEGGMFDVSNPATRTWLANRYKQLTDEGIASWWGDLGEPEVHPQTGLHANGLSARQYHNRYGNDWSSILHQLYVDEYPRRRMMSMMRGGTTGLQRYDVFPWSTDVSRSWGGLEPQVRIMLNSGLSGLGYMGHDVGGFAIEQKHPVDPELYVRWLQLGTFSPMLRTHAQASAEPYHYTEYQDIILPLIKDRYRWLPYNYTLAWENATKGYPLVRPLNFHSETVTDEYDKISDEYLWGSEVLVAPVMTQGAVSRNIVLPAGGQWVDFYNPTKYYRGGTEIKNYPAPLSRLPLFVRAGAFIPMADYEMSNTRDYDPNRLTVMYYPDNAPSEYTMFEDDMATPTAITANGGRTITFRGESNLRTVQIRINAAGEYPGMKQYKQIEVVVNNITAKPAKVKINGLRVKYQYDAAKSCVVIPTKWDTKRPCVVTVEK